jgi:hypothetical protein
MVLFVLLLEVVEGDGPREQKGEQQKHHHAAEDAQSKGILLLYHPQAIVSRPCIDTVKA